MEIKGTLEFHGPADEVTAFLARFGQLAGELGIGTGSTVDDVPQWTPELADRLIDRITEKARRGLRFMLENPPETYFEDLQQHLGLNGIEVGGVMASFGFAVNAGIPRPYVVDTQRRRYVVDPQVAPVLLAAIDRYEERHGQAA